MSLNSHYLGNLDGSLCAESFRFCLYSVRTQSREKTLRIVSMSEDAARHPLQNTMLYPRCTRPSDTNFERFYYPGDFSIGAGIIRINTGLTTTGVCE